jgi:hypothetical protein
MVLVKVLARKDAASLVVAIAGGVVLSQVVMSLSNSIISWILDTGSDLSFKADILQPLLELVLAFVLLECLVRLVIAVRGSMGSR